MTGSAGFQSSLQGGDDVEERARLCLEKPAAHAATAARQRHVQGYHGNQLLANGATGQLPEKEGRKVVNERLV